MNPKKICPDMERERKEGGKKTIQRHCRVPLPEK
jgi:hypothetical protein